MGNLFIDLPVPVANGPGAAVDVSAMGKSKSIVCGGVFDATVNLEFSTDAGAAVWAPLATFHQSGNLVIDIAAHWIRANVVHQKGAVSGRNATKMATKQRFGKDSAIAATSAIRRCPTRQRSSLSQARPARSLGVVLRFSCIFGWLMLWARIGNHDAPAEKLHRQDGIAQWPIQGQPPDQSGEIGLQ